MPETWIIVGIVLAGAVWALVERQRYRISRTVRASVDDLWDICYLQRGKPPLTPLIESVEWANDGSDSGYFITSKIRIRFEQQVDQTLRQTTCICVPVDASNQPNGDVYETTVNVTADGDCARYVATYRFDNRKGVAIGYVMARVLRPLSIMQLPLIMDDCLRKSGALERFEAAYGPPALPKTVLGMPMTPTSLILAVLAFVWLAWRFSYWEAIALTVCVFLHELGHVAAMRFFGDKDSKLYFVPIFGGVAISQQPLSADWKLVAIVLAGPAAGLLSTVAIWAWAVFTDNQWFVALAALSALINAFNLVPISMLDGGQILNAVLRPFAPWQVRRWVAIGSLLIGIAAAVYIKSTLIVVLFGLFCILQFVSSGDDAALSRRTLSARELIISVLATALVSASLVWLFLHMDHQLDSSIFRTLAFGP